MRFRNLFLISLLGFLCIPTAAFAHEVYVLTPTEIQHAVVQAPFSEVAVVFNNASEFLFWAFVGVFMVLVVFFISISHALEARLDPFLTKLRRFAAPVARVTIGLSFIAAAYYQALYGPELPLSATFGAYAGVVTAILAIMGVMLVAGIYTRAVALVALAFWLFTFAVYGIYTFTYTNYLGEILVLLVLGSHHGAAPHASFRAAHRAASGWRQWTRTLALRFAPYSFLVLRVCFGFSLLYASVYAKIFHNQLALLVAELPLGHAHSLATVFGLEPHFLVLGAAIVEIVIAAFFILGIEIRFTALFLLFWLTLSLIYFGEVVWPHLILIGIPIAFMFYGYDKYSLEGWLFKKGAREPVL